MNTSILLAQAAQAAEEAHVVVELPMHPILFGVVTFSALFLLMLVTMSWKGISHRH